MSITSKWPHNQRRQRRPEVIPEPRDHRVVAGSPGPMPAHSPPNADAMDVYVAAIRCGQSEEVACRAALAAEKRRFEEMWRRETEHWTRRLIDIESRKPPQPIITPKPPGQ